MSDGLDLGRLERMARDTQRMVADLEYQVRDIDRSVRDIDDRVAYMSDELIDLKNRFLQLMDEQRRANIIQKAATELVRVRQEIEKDFGDYRIVRKTMLGVLQATDVALVRETTIAKVSEEIMLATPNYWLSPCLVAISAWIANDRALAERAIKVALDRNKEKTALIMALVCRRNKRTDTCYEWLSLYFSSQKPSGLTEGAFTFIDAYINGVFGVDRKHLCDDYISKWLGDIVKVDENFEDKQINKWEEYCSAYDENVTGYEELQGVKEYDRISAYIARIKAAPKIKEEFINIEKFEVDSEALKKAIDEELIKMVKTYDQDEMRLIKEEQYYELIKKLNGDEVKADQMIKKQEEARKQATKNLIEQMTEAIQKEKSPSKKKTALSFVGSYVEKGYNKYIASKKKEFPSEISFEQDGCEIKLDKNSNLVPIFSNYENYMNAKKAEQLSRLNGNQSSNWKMISIIAAVIGVISLVSFLPLGIILMLFAGFAFFQIKNSENQYNKQIENTNKEYQDALNNGKSNIINIFEKWNKTVDEVDEFEQKGGNRLLGGDY